MPLLYILITISSVSFGILVGGQVGIWLGNKIVEKRR